MFDIRENLKILPDKPGVYLYKDRFGEIIYVGKATSLKNRVRQYFQASRNLPVKVQALVSHIDEFEYIVTASEMEALILENQLIKKNQPRYNVLLRDDKTYPYIKVTMGEAYPRVIKTRRVLNDGGKYFGPFTDVGAVNQMIDLINRVYPLKKCGAQRFPKGARPCLNAHIGVCRGVCAGTADQEAYREMVESVLAFLQGKDDSLRRRLQEEMERAAAAFQFEKAALLRDDLNALKVLKERQIVVTSPSAEMDVIVCAPAGEGMNLMIFYVRDGMLIGRDSYQMRPQVGESPAEVTAAFIKQYYSHQPLIPREIVVEAMVEEYQAVSQWLSGQKGSAVKILAPRKGEKKALLEMARQNLAQMGQVLEKRAQNEEEKTRRLEAALRERLGLTGKIERIEAYDISNTSGVDSVGVMVVFEHGKKRPRDYRKFRIKTIEGPNDYGSLQEVIYRRFRHYQAPKEGAPEGEIKEKAFEGSSQDIPRREALPESIAGDSFRRRPDLLLIDGGEKQAAAVEGVLSAMKLDIPVVGMVKDDRHRTHDLVYRGERVNLKEDQELFRFIYFIQEEVHRFAITYHRKLRGKKMERSVLDQIGGIGEKRRNALLSHFGSVKAIGQATEEQLAQVETMDRRSARAVADFFKARQKEQERE